MAAELVRAFREGGGDAVFVESAEEAGEWMRGNVQEGDVVLVKGSRGVRLERALEGLGSD